MATKRSRFDDRVFTISDLAAEAAKRVPKPIEEYINSGAGDMETLHDNQEAFRRYKLRPRVLRNVADVDTSTSILGCKAAFPLGWSPSAAHGLSHKDAELATSRAAAKNGIPMILSSWSNTRLEDVIAAGRGNAYAMQVTLLKDKDVTLQMIRRAEREAIAISERRLLVADVDLQTPDTRHFS